MSCRSEVEDQCVEFYRNGHWSIRIHPIYKIQILFKGNALWVTPLHRKDVPEDVEGIFQFLKDMIN